MSTPATMEPVSLVITRRTQPGPLGESAAVIFDTRNGSLQLRLFPGDLIAWEFMPSFEGVFEVGSDLRWALGRICGSGPTARRFWDLKEAMGLTLGQLEAELRELTGYREG